MFLKVFSYLLEECMVLGKPVAERGSEAGEQETRAECM